MDPKDSIRSIKDFPKKGLYYRDLTPLYLDPAALKVVLDKMLIFARSSKPTKIVGIESSGFMLGAILAREMGVGFAPARRYGRLPFEVLKVDFTSDYRDAKLELQLGSVKKGDRVLICDDIIATGTTIQVLTEMVQELGGEVIGVVAAAELEYLKARERLKGMKVFCPIVFKTESAI